VPSPRQTWPAAARQSSRQSTSASSGNQLVQGLGFRFKFKLKLKW
jgi:hypothetical protein